MNKEQVFDILIAPHVSEKTTNQGEKANVVVFRVKTSATKLQVKQAVEALFEVKVDKVNLLNNKGKAKFFRGKAGRQSDWKKAYVRLSEGSDINFLEDSAV